MKVVISFLVCILSFPSFAWSQVKEDTGLFVVIVNDKRGFIDRNGKVVIAPQFERAGDFSEGVAIIATHRDRKEGYIDETGKIVIDTKFDRAYDFSEGLALVGAGEFGLHNSGDHE